MWTDSNRASTLSGCAPGDGAATRRCPPTQTSTPDSPLALWLEAVAQHDHRAFTQLYQATHAHLYSLALRLMNQADSAEDILQDAFVRVWRCAHQYNPTQAKPMTWLINIVRNRAIDALRSQRVQRKVTEPWDDVKTAAVQDPQADPVADTAHRAAQQRLDVGLSQLNGPQRQAISLTYYQGWQHPEIASAMQVPLSTSKSWVRRGLHQLKQHLEATDMR